MRSIRVPEGEVRIGRWEGSEIVLPSAKVSRIHALLSCRDGFATIKDAHSTNGTFVNGQSTDVMPVLDGDLLKLADVELLFCRMEGPTVEVALPWQPATQDTAIADLTGLLATEPIPMQAASTRSGRAQSVGEGVAFTLPLRGREVAALITYDALVSHFGAYAFGEESCSRAVDAYEANHLAIHVAATYRYEAFPQEPVVLRARDF